MKILSQEQWVGASHQPAMPTDEREKFWEEVGTIVGSEANPKENDVPDGTAEDAVCLTDDHITELRALADWYDMGNEEPAYPSLPYHLAEFANALESL